MINIPFTDYASMKPQRMPLADLISDYMEGREYRQRLKMMPEEYRKAQQDNEHQALINKWYEPNIQSEIGLRGAQTGKFNKDIEWYDRDMASTIDSRRAQAALQGLQSDVIRKHLPYLDEEYRLGNEKQSYANRASSFKNQIMEVVARAMKEREMGGSPEGQDSSYSPGGGGAPYSEGMGSGQPLSLKSAIGGGSSGSSILSDPTSLMIASQVLGYKPHFRNVNGEEFVDTPLGSSALPGRDLTEQDKALIKVNSGILPKLAEQNFATGKGLEVANILGNAVQDKRIAQIFDTMPGKPLELNKLVAQYSGDPETKAKLASIRSLYAQAFQEAATGFKGAFRNIEAPIIESLKPNENDTWSEARGKIAALRMVKQHQFDLEQRTMELMGGDKPLSYQAASARAFKEINSPQLMKEIELLTASPERLRQLYMEAERAKRRGSKKS